MENQEELQSIKCLVFDENEDGILDNIVEFTKNGLGRVATISLDYDGDGKIDTKIYLEYNDDGSISKKCIDKNLDGKIDAIEIYSYDENGFKTVQYDDNADGKIDFIEMTDENGETIIKDKRGNTQKIVETIKNVFFSKY